MPQLHMKWLSVCLLLLLAVAFKKPGLPTEPSIETILASYPKDYFINPVNDDIKLTGTFGELRPDHFHSGIDIKSKTGGVGQPVFAAAAGFIDRIKVQAGGYGNVLYLKHPNGYTTLYAHLDRFSPEVEQYVREQQYKKERFEIDLQPSDGQFKMKQGQEIGKLGNSGSSSGPHLHFEIRNSATQKVLNPLLFGLPVPDNVAPDIRELKTYFLTEQREILHSRSLKLKETGANQYGVAGDTIRLGAWRVGFGVKTYDQMSGFRNDNGIFALSLSADDQLVYEWRMAELDFDETRYLNAHTDFTAKKQGEGWFQRCFVLPGDQLSNYVRTAAQGAVNLYREKPVKVHIKVIDAGGNTSAITFWVLRDEEHMENFVSNPFQYEFGYDRENEINTEDFALSMPKGTLYESLRLEYNTTPDASNGVYSPVHHLHHDKVPIHRYFDIGIKPYGLPENLRSKAVVVRCGDNKPDNCGGSWNGDRIATQVRNFGDYCIMTDTVPPSIVPVVFNEDMRNRSEMAFRISDNFDVSGSADRMQYRGEVDGRWILFEYDSKRGRLTHTFDGRIPSGEHLLKLIVQDDRSNKKVLERKFRR
jgi:hypothetical protein